MNALLEQAKAAAAKLKDQTKDDGPKFSDEPPAAGATPARLVGYVELGDQPQPDYQGKAKPDHMEAMISFELLGKKHAKTITVDGVEKVVYPLMHERIAVKSGDRAKFTKLLKAMDYGRGNTHMAFMLNDGFLLRVTHREVPATKDRKARTFANIYKDGEWSVSAPRVFDPETDEERPVSVPEATVPLRLFLWDSPTMEMWNSIFIEGSYKTKNEKGEEVERTKNFLQETIMKASNFAGSAVQTMLAEAVGDLPKAEVSSEAEKAPLDDDLIDDEPTQPEEKKATTDAPVDADDDPLAGLDIE